MLYSKKETPRLSVKYIDSDTNEELFSIGNRNWQNACDLLSSNSVSKVMEEHCKGEPPDNLLVIVVGEFIKNK